MDEPLPEGNWPLIAPSPIPYGPNNQTPREMTRDDMERVKAEFVQAARWGLEAGFDWLELHCAHGYLLSAFICPLTNQRSDAYGGSLENRCRYPLEVFAAMRAAWPADRPMSVRISAHDWAPGGNTPDDAVAIARGVTANGAAASSDASGQAAPRTTPSTRTRAEGAHREKPCGSAHLAKPWPDAPTCLASWAPLKKGVPPCRYNRKGLPRRCPSDAADRTATPGARLLAGGHTHEADHQCRPAGRAARGRCRGAAAGPAQPGADHEQR